MGQQQFSSHPTSAFRHLGPFPIASALCCCITKQHIGRQALVRALGAVRSGVPCDLFVINDFPKLWDWSQTTLQSFSRRHMWIHKYTATPARALVFPHEQEVLSMSEYIPLHSGAGLLHIPFERHSEAWAPIMVYLHKPHGSLDANTQLGDNVDSSMCDGLNEKLLHCCATIKILMSPFIAGIVEGAPIHRVRVIQLSVQHRFRIGASLCCRRGAQMFKSELPSGLVL